MTSELVLILTAMTKNERARALLAVCKEVNRRKALGKKPFPIQGRKFKKGALNFGKEFRGYST